MASGVIDKAVECVLEQFRAARRGVELHPGYNGVIIEDELLLEFPQVRFGVLMAVRKLGFSTAMDVNYRCLFTTNSGLPEITSNSRSIYDELKNAEIESEGEYFPIFVRMTNAKVEPGTTWLSSYGMSKTTVYNNELNFQALLTFPLKVQT